MSAKPRIVHVYKDYWPPVVGGIERTIHWMAHGTCERFDVTVLVNSTSSQTTQRTDGPIRIIEVGAYGRIASAPIAPSMPRWLRKLEADIWHFHIPNPTGDMSWLLSRPKGRVVATYHSDIVRQAGALKLYAPFLRAFLRKCDVVMPTSPRLIDSSPFLSAVRERCTPVPLGMPQERFARTPASAGTAREIRKRYPAGGLAVFVGRLRYYKGLHFAIGALRHAPGASLLVIGEGGERAKLEQLAREVGVADRVFFVGELSDDDMAAHLQAADVFVFPSHLRSEAYGLSQIEAMASGLPVICCDLPTGVPWVTQDGVTGIVVPPENEEALGAALKRILSDHAMRFRMGEAALRRASTEFTADAMNARLMDVYDRVLQASS